MRWIVFDYGEVISRRPTSFAGLAESLGVSAESFEPAYWKYRDDYDRGCSDLEFWRAVGAQLDVDVTPEQSAALTQIDIEIWLGTDPETLALLRDLVEVKVGLALLSNAPSSHGEVFRTQPWAKHFDHVVISGDLGIAKPDKEIWRALVDQLGAEPADCLFLDDKQVNIEGARAAGLHAQRWTDATAARAHIAETGVL